MIRGLCHVVEQELEQQGAAKLSALNLEVGKAHREIGVLNRVNADEAGVFHRPGEAVAARGIRRGAAVLRAGLAEIFAADRLVAGPPFGAAEPAALVAEKFHLCLICVRKGAQLVEGSVQTEIRHDIAKLRPRKLPPQQGKIRQYLCGGGDKVERRVCFAQVVQQQLRVDDHAVWRAAACSKQPAELAARRIREVFRAEEGVAEGQAGFDVVFLHQRQHLARVVRPRADAPAAPETVRRGAVDRADIAPVVKIRPMAAEQGQKDAVEVVEFKQAGQVIVRGGAGLRHVFPPDRDGCGASQGTWREAEAAPLRP